MRILRVAQHVYPDTKGGGQYHVHAMSRDQASMGHDVTVLTTREDDSLPRVERTHNYTVLRVAPGISVIGNDISPAMVRYLWHVGSDEYDVVHAHSHMYFSTNIAALRRQFVEIPLAITNHGLYSQSASERIFRWYLETLGRRTFDQADIIFCYTKIDKKRIRDLGVNSRIEVVPNGINTEQFTPKGPESDLIDTEGPVILFVGRFVDGKQPWLVIEAFAEVLVEYPSAELYLCGDGPLRENLKSQVNELGIAEYVTFLGHIPHDEMPKIYRSGDVLMLPSRAEGVPRTVLEAMSSGTAVVTSHLEQMAGIVNQTGQTVKNISGKTLAESVSHVLESELDVSERAVRDHDYKWQSTVKRTTEYLESICHCK
jgi:glycosyltransferase involved in cell wall biosynthesis